LELQQKIIIRIDLAEVPKNQTGWAAGKNKEPLVRQLYTDKEIIEATLNSKPILAAIDAPLSLQIEGLLRQTDRELHKQRASSLSSTFPHNRKTHKKSNRNS
jgi:predicted nuclease with RNAse H fold